MSGRREDLVNSEWTDGGELLPFSSDGKLFAIWCRTNRSMGLSGFARISPPAIRFETALSLKRYERALDELLRAGYVRYDEPLLFVPSRTGRLSGINPNMARSIYRDLENVGAHPFRNEFLGLYYGQKWFLDSADLVSLYERVSETVGKPLGNPSETYRDRDRDGDGV